MNKKMTVAFVLAFLVVVFASVDQGLQPVSNALPDVLSVNHSVVEKVALGNVCGLVGVFAVGFEPVTVAQTSPPPRQDVVDQTTRVMQVGALEPNRGVLVGRQVLV